jgi:aldehyde:ferredoxin oxidoreductase
MANGYTGKILWVDLTKGETRDEKTTDYRQWIGGRGLATYLLSQISTLGSEDRHEQPLVVSAGPLVGTGLPLGVRTSVAARSQVSGGVFYSNVGGDFGTRLKMAGYDAVVVEGCSPTPVYLFVSEATIEIISAQDLWGLKISDLQGALFDKHGQDDVSFIGIGPAGEQEATLACLMVDQAHAAGWGGSGAILGAKGLKAIVAQGDRQVPVFDAEGLEKKAAELIWRMNNSQALMTLSSLGTHGMVAAGGALGHNPTSVKNLQDGYLPSEENAPLREAEYKPWEVSRAGCYGCGIQCLHRYNKPVGRHGEIKAEGMHANSVRGFGSNLGVKDPEDVLMMHYLCNEYGLDVDGVSAVVAFALECAEHGILETSQAEGVKLQWGDGASLVKLVEQIGERRALGKLLGEGVHVAAQEIGLGSQEFAMMTKQVGINEGSIRSHPAWALGIITSTRGGGHLGGSPQTENRRIPAETGKRLFGNPDAGVPGSYQGKGELVAWTEGLKAVIDCLGLCYFAYGWYDLSLGNPNELAEMYTLATGYSITGAELHQRGLMIHSLERYLSWRFGGYSRPDDQVPDRLYDVPVSVGPYQGASLDREMIERELDAYYDYLGWDVKTGLPTEESLKELGLGFFL